VERRPFDSLVRENLLDTLEILENPKLSNFESPTHFNGMPSGCTGPNSYMPLQEQLRSDDIQQIYASRLHFQQKLK
jgi:hypothetical protein